MKLKWLSPENSKLGAIANWSEPRLLTCPGASALCKGETDANVICYMSPILDRWRNVLAAHLDRYELTFRRAQFRRELAAECASQPLVRLYVDGDMSRISVINDWIQIIRACPNTVFFGFTRSWSVSRLLPALERLRALPNVRLRASWDMTMRPIPAGWVQATMGKDGPGIICPEIAKTRDSCLECGICFKNRMIPVRFPIH